MRPSAIVNFERLFVASLVIGVATLIVFAAPGEGFPLLEVATLVVSFVLMLLVSRGRSNVVRWILSVLVVLGVPLLFYPLFDGASLDLPFLISFLSSALQLSAVALLWTKGARAWFADSNKVVVAN